MKLEFSWHIFKKYSNIKFKENLSGWSRIVPFRRMDGQTDMTKLTVLFAMLCTHLTKILRLFHFHQPSIIPCMYKAVQKKCEEIFMPSQPTFDAV
jgi:hypothetical protein